MKKQSGFIKDAIILFAITLISGLILGFVYDITKAPIAAAAKAAKNEAYAVVFPDAKDFDENDAEKAKIAETADEISGKGFGHVNIDAVVDAKDKSGNNIGRVITATSKDGYNGTVQLSVGIKSDGTVVGITFLTLAETPGLGMRAGEKDFYSQFANKNTKEFKLVKGSAGGDNEISAISGSTITSSAVTNAVDAALYFNSILE
ncbi:electron transport complex, RnfABCDGE type, G subunit [Lachnoanaerobaculum saburreum F0468]|uniref:Ion-translocating oxidoreductase complex subunit G n=1 Tax=Lachnoanaerobaculum saburreum F0468 TaxID=1095750 RepID=I0RBR8_9FIRM|nr:RnfABCDGE type electron transport complex subunit G [Lachnoanaerobaculum saburreum]EIC97126.1 electron transport complex, RnfABCDGE type, G subunit [Lachnoanaerobaculum saburreum F0468]